MQCTRFLLDIYCAVHICSHTGLVQGSRRRGGRPCNTLRRQRKRAEKDPMLPQFDQFQKFGKDNADAALKTFGAVSRRRPGDRRRDRPISPRSPSSRARLRSRSSSAPRRSTRPSRSRPTTCAPPTKAPSPSRPRSARSTPTSPATSSSPTRRSCRPLRLPASRLSKQRQLSPQPAAREKRPAMRRAFSFAPHW